MIQKEFDAVGKEDVESLIENGVKEGRTLEYKLLLPENTDEGKREFLADVSAFANASGGDIIFGIREGKDADQPDLIEGLGNIDSDAQIRRMEETLRACLDPKIPNVRFRSIDGFANGPVILLRIPKSWQAPHMVTFKGSSRFFTRTSVGKHQLDVREIRSAFIATETQQKKIDTFRNDRLAKIIAEETPSPLFQNPKVILHLFPLSSLESRNTLKFNVITQNTLLLSPLGGLPQKWRANIDGYLTIESYSHHSSPIAYFQIFHSGAIESVSSTLIDGSDDSKIIHINHIYSKLLEYIKKYIDLYVRLEILPPIIVFVTLCDVNGYKVPYDPRYMAPYNIHPIDRDVLQLPEVIVEDYSVDLRVFLKPILDSLWQAVGFTERPSLT